MITRTAITDDDGTGTTGTVINAAWKTELYDQIDALVAGVNTLTDGATVALNAGLPGGVYRLVAAGDRTILAPTNATSGQKIIIQHVASGSTRTLTLTTGSAGAFRFGSDITAMTVTASGKTDYIGCVYNGTDSRWDVVAYSKGY